MIELRNLRRGQPDQPYDYRADRSNKILGNHPGQGLPRELAIEAFRVYFDQQLADKSLPMNPVRAEMNRLYALHKKYGRLRIWCWCVPLNCHTELIKSKLESVL